MTYCGRHFDEWEVAIAREWVQDLFLDREDIANAIAWDILDYVAKNWDGGLDDFREMCALSLDEQGDKHPIEFGSLSQEFNVYFEV
jgi:hypothetical protein